MPRFLALFSIITAALATSAAIGQPVGFPALPRGTETCWNADSFPIWPFPGDANRDGSIDQRDLDKVMADLGQAGRLRVPKFFGPIGDGVCFGNLWSDFNGDGVVDMQDLAVVTTALSARVCPASGGGVPAGGLPLLADGAIDLTGTEYGLALVWPEQPVDIGPSWNGSPLPSKPMRTVLLTDLGVYSRVTGERVSGNNGVLDGRYLTTDVQGLPGQAPIARVLSPANDFRINLMALAHPWPRDLVAWQSEASAYFGVSEWRRRLFNGAFLDRLALPPGQNQRVRINQGIPDWQVGQPVDQGGCTGNPCLSAFPKITIKELATYGSEPPWANYLRLAISLPFGLGANSLSAFRLSPCWSDSFSLLEYPTAIGEFLIAKRPYDESVFGSQLRFDAIGALVGDGMPEWANLRYEGAIRKGQVALWPVALSTADSAPGFQVRVGNIGNETTVMMQDIDGDGRINAGGDGLYPPASSNLLLFAPSPMDTATTFFGATFRDVAIEAGLGEARADLLYWRALALAEGPANVTNLQFGDLVRAAARLLWPNPSLPGASVYEGDVRDVLLSRKFLPPGSVDIEPFLPAAIGPSVRNVPVRSSHPSRQPGVAFARTDQAVANWYSDQFTHPESRASYVAYTWWKHSKVGPCDYLDLVADGVSQPASFFPCDPEPLPGEPQVYLATYARVSGPPSARLRDREIGNLTTLLPGRVMRWVHMRAMCPINPSDSLSVLDVNAFGFRCIKATPNGFSVRVERVGETEDPTWVRDRVNYRLTVVDPSIGLTGWNTGPASYDWTFTEFDGATTNESGQVVSYAAVKDQPLTISITRTRTPPSEPPIVDTLTLRERGTDLDRTGIQGPGTALAYDGVKAGFLREWAPQAQVITCSGTATLKTRSIGLQPRTVRWRRNGLALSDGPTGTGSVIAGSGTDVLTISGVQAGDVGVYDCVATNALGSSVSPSATVTVTGPCVCGRADIASLGGNLVPDGQLTVDDLVAFLGAFFSNNLLVADVAGLGGVTTGDGQLTVDDLVVYLAMFFAGCQ